MATGREVRTDASPTETRSSLRLLRHLAGELHRSRLLVIGTYRDPAGAHGAALFEALFARGTA